MNRIQGAHRTYCAERARQNRPCSADASTAMHHNIVAIQQVLDDLVDGVGDGID